MKPTILIVEDDPALAGIFAKIVLSIDCSYIGASTVKEGLFALKQKRFEVVLCDLLLADGCGILVAEKALQKKSALIIVTGFAERFSEELFRLSKIHSNIKILHKPFPLLDLEVTLLDLVGPLSR